MGKEHDFTLAKGRKGVELFTINSKCKMFLPPQRVILEALQLIFILQESCASDLKASCCTFFILIAMCFLTGRELTSSQVIVS